MRMINDGFFLLYFYIYKFIFVALFSYMHALLTARDDEDERNKYESLLRCIYRKKILLKNILIIFLNL